MKTALLLFTSVLLVSCTASRIPPIVSESFSNRYTEPTPPIRSLIEVDGYFSIKIRDSACYGYGKKKECYDSVMGYFMFYDNGAFVENFIDTSILKQGAQADRKKIDQFYGMSSWGAYRIEGDSIIVAQSIFKPPVRQWQRHSWSFMESRFQILNPTTLRLVRQSGVTGDGRKLERDRLKENQPLVASFHPTFLKPAPADWLQNELDTLTSYK